MENRALLAAEALDLHHAFHNRCAKAEACKAQMKACPQSSILFVACLLPGRLADASSETSCCISIHRGGPGKGDGLESRTSKDKGHRQFLKLLQQNRKGKAYSAQAHCCEMHAPRHV